MLKIEIIISWRDMSPISTNDMHVVSRGRKIKSQKYRDLSQRFAREFPRIERLEKYKESLGEEISRSKMNNSLEIYWYTDILYKNGKVRTKDCSNILKPLEDMLVSATEIDDRFNFRVGVAKIQKKGEHDITRIVYSIDDLSEEVREERYEMIL